MVNEGIRVVKVEPAFVQGKFDCKICSDFFALFKVNSSVNLFVTRDTVQTQMQAIRPALEYVDPNFRPSQRLEDRKMCIKHSDEMINNHRKQFVPFQNSDH